MADAIAVQVSDAIVAALKGSSLLAENLRPVRSWAEWAEELSECDVLHLDVVPSAWTVEQETRADLQWTVAVDIGVRFKFDVQHQDQTTGRIRTAEVDRLVKLVEDIAEYFMADRLTTLSGAAWRGSTVKVPYSREMLRECKQFLGIVTVTHVYQRAIP